MSYRSNLMEQIEALYSQEELERLAANNVFRLLASTQGQLESMTLKARAPAPAALTADSTFSYKRGFSEALTTIKRVCEQSIETMK